MDHQLWGPAPWGFHITKLLLHILTALLIHRLLLRLEELEAARAESAP
jgi:hypothetical protein